MRTLVPSCGHLQRRRLLLLLLLLVVLVAGVLGTSLVAARRDELQDIESAASSSSSSSSSSSTTTLNSSTSTTTSSVAAAATASSTHEAAAAPLTRTGTSRDNHENDHDDSSSSDDDDDEGQFRRKAFVSALLLVLNVSYYVLYWKRKQLEKRLGMPVMDRSPFGDTGSSWECRQWPVLGHAITFLRFRPWDLLTAWHVQSHSGIIAFGLLGKLRVSIAKPVLIKQVLQSKIASVKKDIQDTMKPFLVILGQGLVSSEDASWMKQRLKMSHPLRRDVLEMIPAQTVAAVQRLCESIEQQQNSTASSADCPLPVGSSLRHLTLQVISGTFLSLSPTESDQHFAVLYLPIVEESNKRVWHPYRAFLPLLPSFWEYWIHVYRLNQYVSSLIRQRWTQRRRHASGTYKDVDILDLVLADYEKEQSKAGRDLPTVLPEFVVRQFRDEMKTFILAGHETSAAMMTWALYEVLANPMLFQSIRAEGEAIFGKDPIISNPPTNLPCPAADKLAQLIFSEATLKESLRKYSVVPIVARRAVEDLYLEEEEVVEENNPKGGTTKKRYFIPAGTQMYILIQAVHHDPTIWKDPMKFDPYRFLATSENSNNNNSSSSIDPYHFLPFIAGPRNCLGQHLALLESKMVLAMLLARYDLTLCTTPPDAVSAIQVDDWSTEAADPRHRYMVPVVPKRELYVIAKKRT